MRVLGFNPSYFQGINYPSPEARPVENVSWTTIQPFLEATGMRLPTEAEWEYAYRSGTQAAYHGTALFPEGTDDDLLAPQLGWWGGLCCAGNGGPHPQLVGGLFANGLGFHDMAGNVWEIVSDIYDAAYYASSPPVDPQGPSAGIERVMRGGSHSTALTEMRASKRRAITSIESNGNIGFRVARSP
jgi:formylglycine-generating enzyme required for sulfatase activity